MFGFSVVRSCLQQVIVSGREAVADESMIKIRILKRPVPVCTP